jgi:membrane protein DedA with SNARE-associated domain
MPGLAGVSRMHYRRFLVANALGGLVWGVAFCLLGYYGGSQLTKIEKYSGWASIALVALIVVAVLGAHYARKIARKRGQETKKV